MTFLDTFVSSLLGYFYLLKSPFFPMFISLILYLQQCGFTDPYLNDRLVSSTWQNHLREEPAGSLLEIILIALREMGRLRHCSLDCVNGMGVHHSLHSEWEGNLSFGSATRLPCHAALGSRIMLFCHRLLLSEYSYHSNSKKKMFLYLPPSCVLLFLPSILLPPFSLPEFVYVLRQDAPGSSCNFLTLE